MTLLRYDDERYSMAYDNMNASVWTDHEKEDQTETGKWRERAMAREMDSLDRLEASASNQEQLTRVHGFERAIELDQKGTEVPQ